MLNVLFFPHDEGAPRIVQTECRISILPGGAEEHHIDFSSLQIPGFTSLPVGPLEQPTPSAGPGAGQTRLYLAFDDCFAINDAPPNRAARTLTRGRAHTAWAGALLGYRAREPAMTIAQFEDVSMADVPAFAAFLTEHGAPASSSRAAPDPALDPARMGLFFERLRAASSFVDDDAEPPLNWGTFDGAGLRSARAWQPPELDEGRAEREQSMETRLVLVFRLVVVEEFVRLRAQLSKIVAEEVMRALLTILVCGASVYGTWRFVVLPILSLPGMLFGMVSTVLRAAMRLCWGVLILLMGVVV
ncbi:hypothetical protein BC628DRAFT_1347196 [Trametes gibbosa]|nr:hypothetical protein BC628DRAFT_1347196 [Trametes gibbosa]